MLYSSRFFKVLQFDNEIFYIQRYFRLFTSSVVFAHVERNCSLSDCDILQLMSHIRTKRCCAVSEIRDYYNCSMFIDALFVLRLCSVDIMYCAFSALKQLVGRQEEHPVCKN